MAIILDNMTKAEIKDLVKNCQKEIERRNRLEVESFRTQLIDLLTEICGAGYGEYLVMGSWTYEELLEGIIRDD